MKSADKQPTTGFTLVEILISLSLLLIIFLAVVSVYTISQRLYVLADNQAEISQNGRVIIDRLTRELRQTQDIVTTLPATNSNPETLPDEIMFQDGHDPEIIRYIRYYLDGQDIKKQIIAYYFTINPEQYVYWHAIDQNGNPPQNKILEDKIIGEYVYDWEFWGNKLIYINIYLVKNQNSQIINTAIYGRNL